jgi:hypothetical protein
MIPSPKLQPRKRVIQGWRQVERKRVAVRARQNPPPPKPDA